MTGVDYFELARDITRAHADKLLAGDTDVTVAEILVAVRRCPSCAGPLLTGDRVGYCAGCGSEVDVEALA